LIALDASALVDWLIGSSPSGERVAERMREASRWHALDLTMIEVASALRRQVRLERLPEPRGRLLLGALMRAPIRRHRVLPYLPRVWDLRNVHSTYDAAHVALAEALRVPLLTTDRRLARSRGHRAKILDLSASRPDA